MKKSTTIQHTVKKVCGDTPQNVVVVAKHAYGKDKSITSDISASILIAALSLFGSPAVLAGPDGGVITSGSGSINQANDITTITQTSDTLSANWNSFNIESNETVNFNQPNAKSIAVNHILDTSGSRIMGNLNANGQVWLINPNGVFFGQSATVDVGSILAATLNPMGNITTNGAQTFSGNGKGSIVNFGDITANGGYVALIANQVSNQGNITANNGSVALGAGSQVTLQFADSNLLSLTVDQSTLDNLAENKQLIKANGGMVLISAGAKDSLLASVVNNEGKIEAKTVQYKDGKIILMGGMHAGTTKVSGTLDASAEAGNGGFIETSAAYVTVADDAKVTTKAKNGETGTWLIDPVDFTVAASGGDMTGAAVNTALASNNFQIESTTGANGTAGDININDVITWSNNNSLTLTAQNNININEDITATGATAKLNLEYGQAAVEAGNTAQYIIDNNAQVNLQAGDNFSTKLGSDGPINEFKVITALGTETSWGGETLQGINGNQSGNYVLGANIDATSTSTWNDDGSGHFSGFDPIIYFTGKLDGLGHTINHLTINRPSEDNVGLVGNSNGGIIQNIGLLQTNITGKGLVGGIVGINTGEITNTYTTGSVTGNSYDIGGLVGRNSGIINHSYATSVVTGVNEVGGLVGENTGTITHAFTTNNVTATADIAGGVAGRNSGSISDAYATGNISGNRYIGGLVGDQNGTVTDAYASGDVVGLSYIGGLTGHARSTTISQVYATGAVSGDSHIGGLVGVSDVDSTIDDAYATGNVTASTSHAGGLVGHNSGEIAASYATGAVTGGNENIGGLVGNNNGAINNVHSISLVTGYQNVGGLLGFNGSLGSIAHANATGDVSGTRDIGGLVGENRGAIIDVFATGDVTASAYVVGGLVGRNTATITHAYATGDVSAGEGYVGGLVGDSTGSISYSYAQGSVSGVNNRVGGLVGAASGTVSDAYATGSVHGDDGYVGGLIGDARTVTISTAYATGTVTGKTNIGGLIGVSANTTSINQTYAEGDVSATGSNVGGLIGHNSAVIVSNSYSTGAVDGDRATGGLVGYNNGIFSNVYTTSVVTGNQTVGGFVGVNNATGVIENVSATVAVAGVNTVGGLVGENRGTITNVFATNQVTASANTVGGLVGRNSGTITQTYATGNVTGQAGYVGGLVGDSTGSISDSYAEGDVSGVSNRVGGLVGAASGTISDAYATGNVHGDDGYIGGLIGNTRTITVSGVYATGDVTGKTNIGGLVGVSSNNALISDAYAQGNVVASNGNAGGLVGHNSGEITESYATGAVAVSNQNSGGLVGYNKGIISDVHSTSLVTGIQNIGGLVGHNAAQGVISHANATGDVSGVGDVGGLIGESEGSVSIAYATGNATASSNVVGGLVGHNRSTIMNAYATGNVTGEAGYIGGLVGDNRGAVSTTYANGTVTGSNITGGLIGNNSGTVSNSFSDVDTTSQVLAIGFGDVTGATTQTTTQLQQLSTVTNAGWDASAVGGDSATWRVYEGNTAPLLRYFMTTLDLSANQTTTYNGQAHSYTLPTGTNVTDLVGLNLVTKTNAGTYNNDDASVHSIQQGYDIIAGGQLIIDKANAIVTANSDHFTYNGYSHNAGFSVSGLVNNETIEVLSDVSTPDFKDAGVYTNTASGLDENYHLTFVNGGVNINKANALVTANSGTFESNGQLHSVNGFTAQGLVGQETIAVLDNVIASGASGKTAGTYINGLSGSDENYNLSFINGTLEITNSSVKDVLSVILDEPVKQIRSVNGSEKTLRKVKLASFTEGDKLYGETKTVKVPTSDGAASSMLNKLKEKDVGVKKEKGRFINNINQFLDQLKTTLFAKSTP